MLQALYTSIVTIVQTPLGLFLVVLLGVKALTRLI